MPGLGFDALGLTREGSGLNGVVTLRHPMAPQLVSGVCSCGMSCSVSVLGMSPECPENVGRRQRGQRLTLFRDSDGKANTHDRLPDQSTESIVRRNMS